MQLVRPIPPVTALGIDRRWGEQPDVVVVAQRSDRNPGKPGKGPDYVHVVIEPADAAEGSMPEIHLLEQLESVVPLVPGSFGHSARPLWSSLRLVLFLTEDVADCSCRSAAGLVEEVSVALERERH
jgi:hypothetical protein